MTWKEFLVELQSFSEPFTVTQVADKLDMHVAEASTRLSRLRVHGWIRFADTSRKARGGYLLSDGAKSFKLE